MINIVLNVIAVLAIILVLLYPNIKYFIKERNLKINKLYVLHHNIVRVTDVNKSTKMVTYYSIKDSVHHNYITESFESFLNTFTEYDTNNLGKTR